MKKLLIVSLAAAGLAASPAVAKPHKHDAKPEQAPVAAPAQPEAPVAREAPSDIQRTTGQSDGVAAAPSMSSDTAAPASTPEAPANPEAAQPAR